MTQRFSAYFFCLLLLALFAAGVVRAVQHPLEADPSWVDGKATLKLEKSFEKEQAFEVYAKSLWGMLNYGLFNTTGKGAVVGEDGWFYTAEEFETPKDFDKNIADNLAYIANVKQQLTAKNIALLLVIIPAKARVYPEHLGLKKMPDQRQGLYSRILRHSRAGGNPEIIDGLSVLQTAKKLSPVFMRTDTHWTPEGAEAMAAAVAEQAKLSLPSATFQTTNGDKPKHYSGDLAKFSQTEKLKSLFPELAETRREYTTANASEGDLFGEAAIPVALVGTSYSAMSEWNFTGFLQQALQADVMNVADEGGGPVAPMRKFLKEVLPQNPDLKLVIWEFPERFFPVDYRKISPLPLGEVAEHSDAGEGL